MHIQQPEHAEHASWHIGTLCIEMTWRLPLELLAIDIANGTDARADNHAALPMALRCLALETLMQKLALDDPLLTLLMPVRLDLLRELKAAVTVTDRRPLRQDGKVAILRKGLTT